MRRTTPGLAPLPRQGISPRGLFWDGPRNFERRSDEEDDTWVSTPLQTSAPYRREGIWPRRIGGRQPRLHGGSSVESGFEPGIVRLQGRGLTTRPPRPNSFRGNEEKILNYVFNGSYLHFRSWLAKSHLEDLLICKTVKR
ncbi:hypothetical protein AVEN_133421-1 [Araneus ventricosus]|uniref:Uncharacterized protein n=1 Tax=Araneus ventricosus TaxID=182803 RepID=A0A4Y2SSP9_ARAVE|nr:hypothetical protein AVEN_133421-1 [Araneus ventricosus]